MTSTLKNQWEHSIGPVGVQGWCLPRNRLSLLLRSCIVVEWFWMSMSLHNQQAAPSTTYLVL